MINNSERLRVMAQLAGVVEPTYSIESSGLDLDSWAKKLSKMADALIKENEKDKDHG